MVIWEIIYNNRELDNVRIHKEVIVYYLHYHRKMINKQDQQQI
jgi:hypothetical protein